MFCLQLNYFYRIHVNIDRNHLNIDSTHVDINCPNLVSLYRDAVYDSFDVNFFYNEVTS